jgi:thiamine biosynthesis lipoprotein
MRLPKGNLYNKRTAHCENLRHLHHLRSRRLLLITFVPFLIANPMSTPFIFKRLSAGKTLFYTWFDAMHTRIDMAFCALPEEECRALTESIRQELLRLEKMLSRFDPSGEIAAVNRKAGKETVSVSNELFDVLRACLECSRQTQGYFDITVNSFNHYKKGSQGIVLHEDTSAVSFAHPDIQLDLGGFGKGYALDKCKVIAESHHCRDALLSFGNSSVLALGNHPLGSGWKVGPENDPSQSIVLCNEFLTTSGNGCHGHGHIISPVSGKRVTQLGSVSVKTSSGAWGEALSTALFAASEDFSDGNPPFISSAVAACIVLDSRHIFA